MKCPLRNLITHYPDEQEGMDTFDCLGENCEWWSNNSQLCVISRLAGELYSLVEVMEEIRDKLSAWANTQGVRG